MAVEKASLGYTVDALEGSRISLEKALDRLIEAFKSSPKSIIKLRLKKRAQDVKWPSYEPRNQ